MSLVGAWAAVAVTVLTVYGETMIRTRVPQAGTMSRDLGYKIVFLPKMAARPSGHERPIPGLSGRVFLDGGNDAPAAQRGLSLYQPGPHPGRCPQRGFLHETIKPMQLADIGLVICGLIIVARA